MAQPGVYEGSTNFDVLEGKSPPAYEPMFPGDKGPPEGMSESFWREVINSEHWRPLIEGSIKAGRDWYKDLTNPNNKGSAASQWATLSPSQKKVYTDAEAAGNPYPAFSAEGKLWEQEQEEKNVRDQNVAEFEEWENTYLPGLRETVAGAQAGDEAALAKLEELMGSIQDPELADYVGDMVSQAASAAPSQEAIDAQKRQLSKFESLSDPTVTAEERLMQEMARRQMEQDLRSQRGAIANNLQERGVYGPGQELTMNLMAQNEAANRRALEEMQVQANAQNRAMEALRGAADVSGQIRSSEAQESQFRGTAADRAAEFNKQLRTSYDEWKAREQNEINKNKVGRGETLFDARTGVNQGKINNAGQIAEIGLRGTAGKTGQFSGDSAPVFANDDREADLREKRRDEDRLRY